MAEINWNKVNDDKLTILYNKVLAGTLDKDASRFSIMEALNKEGAGVKYTQAGNYRVALKKLIKETK